VSRVTDIRREFLDERGRLEEEIYNLVAYMNETYRDLKVNTEDVMYYCTSRSPALRESCEKQLSRIAEAEFGGGVEVYFDSSVDKYAVKFTLIDYPRAEITAYYDVKKGEFMWEPFLHTYDLNIFIRIEEEIRRVLKELGPDILGLLEKSATGRIVRNLTIIRWIDAVLERKDFDLLDQSYRRELEEIKRRTGRKVAA